MQLKNLKDSGNKANNMGAASGNGTQLQSGTTNQLHASGSSLSLVNNNNTSGPTVMPRKRGRPSKKAKEQEMMQMRQQNAQKRVRFANGLDQVSYQQQHQSHRSGDDSDEAAGRVDGGDVTGGLYQDGSGVVGGASRSGDLMHGGGDEDYASGYRKNLGDFEEYVKMMNDEHISSQFEDFTSKRRKQVYESLNDLEEERFNAYIEACPKKPMKKKLVELVLQLPG